MKPWLIILLATSCHGSSPSVAIDAAAGTDAIDAPRACPNADGSSNCASDEYCANFSGGILPLNGTCTKFPVACASTPTCACLVANTICGVGVTCTDQGGVDLVCEGI